MVARLTPALKHLLTLRSPNVLPSPPLGQLNALFTKTFRDAQARKAETGWLVLAVRASRLEMQCMKPIPINFFPSDMLAFGHEQTLCGRPPLPFRYEELFG